LGRSSWRRVDCRQVASSWRQMSDCHQCGATNESVVVFLFSADAHHEQRGIDRRRRRPSSTERNSAARSTLRDTLALLADWSTDGALLSQPDVVQRRPALTESDEAERRALSGPLAQSNVVHGRPEHQQCHACVVMRTGLLLPNRQQSATQYRT